MYRGIRVIGKPTNMLSDKAFTVKPQTIKNSAPIKHPLTYNKRKDLIGLAEDLKENKHRFVDHIEGAYTPDPQEKGITIVPISDPTGNAIKNIDDILPTQGSSPAIVELEEILKNEQRSIL